MHESKLSYKSTIRIVAIGGEWEQFQGHNGNEMVYYQMLFQQLRLKHFQIFPVMRSRDLSL